MEQRLEQALQPWIEKTQIGSVRLEPTLDASGKSRLGGTLGTAPLDEEGKPMHLLCALFCSELPAFLGFPERGVLRFYIGQEPMYGMAVEHPSEQKNWRVIFDSDEPENIPKTGQNLQTGSPVKGCFCLKQSEGNEPLMPPDYRFREEFDRFLRGYGRREPISWEEYDLLMQRCSLRGCKLGGYLWCTQDDPRGMCRELEKYDTVLLQIDSNYSGDCRISFGDDGVAFFLMEGDKLKAGDFSDILFWWDCG